MEDSEEGEEPVLRGHHRLMEKLRLVVLLGGGGVGGQGTPTRAVDDGHPGGLAIVLLGGGFGGAPGGRRC